MKRVGLTVVALAVVAVAAVAIGVRLIDRPAVRAEIQTRLSAALGGRIEWDELEVRILPAPHGELRRVRMEIPGALTMRADDVDVYLRLWPLLRGRAEIASLSVSRPQVRIQAAASGGESGAQLDPVAAYRQGITPIAEALRKFAPDTVLTIRDAALDLASPPLELRKLNITARSAGEHLELDIDTASNYWQRLRFEARVAYADLSAAGTLRIDRLALHKDLPPARVRAQLRTDASTSIECDLEAALGALLPQAKGKLTLPAGKAAEIDARLTRLDLPQAIAIVRRHVSGLETIESLDGRLSANVRASLGAQWQARIEVTASDASLKLAQLPWKLSAQAGQVTVNEKELRVAGLRGALGESSFSEVAAQLDFRKPLRLSAASGRATLRLEQWFPWLKQQVPLEELTELSGNVDVTLKRMAMRFDRPAAVDFDALAVPRQVSVTLKSLPAAAAVSGGSVQVDAAQARLDKVEVAMLDAKTVVSGTVAMKGPRIELALAEGALGEKIAQWALARGDVPARFEPRTPLRFAAKRIAWAPGTPLEVEASIDFDGGPSVVTALAWQPDKLDLRSLAIKDARSNAVFGARIAEKLVQASFAGNLDGRSVAAMLRRPPRESGTARGEMRVTIDRQRPERTIAEGQLKLEALDLTWLAGRRVLIPRADLSAQPTGMRIVDAEVDFEEQKFRVFGEVQRTAQGPVIDARIESPGVLVDRLLPAQKGKPEPAAASQPPATSKLWPLPVTGRVEMRAGFVQYQHFKIAPFEGSLDLARERAGLEVKEARMCGVSFPLTAQATAGSLAVSALVTMRNEPLEEVARCATGGTLEVSGNADLRAELRTNGKDREELIRNLSGTAQAELRKGTIKKFALIGNILSVLSLRNVVSRDATLREGGFPYRSLSAKGEFKNGGFLLGEGFFDSDAARIAANGRIDLQGANSRLDVLVGVLNTVDRVAGAIPIIGDIFGSTMLALPVSVSGDIRDPLVVPLGPRAVTDRLLGIFERTLKLPGKLVVPANGEAAPAAR